MPEKISQRIRRLVSGCANTIYVRMPSAEYARCVESLLLETGMVESAYELRRQGGFRWDELRGAWGFWQTECAAVGDGLLFVMARPELRARFEDFCGVDACSLKVQAEGKEADRLMLMQHVAQNDRLAVALCRVHYMRMPGLISGDLAERAGYWKKYYNTVLGSGTVKRYLDVSKDVFSSSPNKVVPAVVETVLPGDGVDGGDTALLESGLDLSAIGVGVEEVEPSDMTNLDTMRGNRPKRGRR